MYFRRGCLPRAGPAKTAGKPPGFWAGPAAPRGLRAGRSIRGGNDTRAKDRRRAAKG